MVPRGKRSDEESGRLGRIDEIVATVADLEGAPVARGAARERANALAVAAPYAFHGGRRELARRVQRELDAAPHEITGDPAVQARILAARGLAALFDGEVEAYTLIRESIVDLYVATGDRRQECGARVNLGFGYAELGLWEQAEAALRPASGRTESELRAKMAAHTNITIGPTARWSRPAPAAPPSRVPTT